MGFWRSTAQRQPVDGRDIVVVPLKEEHNGLTPWYRIRTCGPCTLVAGQVVEAMSTEQIDNECRGVPGDIWRANPLKNVELRNKLAADGSMRYWIEKEWFEELPGGGYDRDPRRSLYVMVELGVWRSKTAAPAYPDGPYFCYQRGDNRDNLQHHGPYETMDKRLVHADPSEHHVPPGIWYFHTFVRFGWTALYLKGMVNPTMEVLDRGTLSVETRP
jgi:hypothetical protein